MTLPATEPLFKSFSEMYKASRASHDAEATTPPKDEVDPAASKVPVKAVGGDVGINFVRQNLSSVPHPKPAKSKPPSSQQDSELTNLTQYPPLKNLNITLMETKMAAHYLRLKVKTLQTWAYKGSGIITPLRLRTKLYWSTDDVRACLGLAGEDCDAETNVKRLKKLQENRTRQD
jgi:hypothetical protein